MAEVFRFIAHSKLAISIARRYGWLPAARYTNLRDVRSFDRLGFLDVEWENYSFKRHLEAAKATLPLMTVAQDVVNISCLDSILDQACELALYCTFVVVVPKDISLIPIMDYAIPSEFLLGYSVPTKYGATLIPPHVFKRPVHLLGGRPDVQRGLADIMLVVSIDCNRFTIDAKYGDYFDGETFRPHPVGGYKRCLSDSIKNINALWYNYPKEKENLMYGNKKK